MITLKSMNQHKEPDGGSLCGALFIYIYIYIPRQDAIYCYVNDYITMLLLLSISIFVILLNSKVIMGCYQDI